MNASELRDKLLATAELLTVLELPQKPPMKCELFVHDVADRASLAGWVRLMREPTIHRIGSTCYVSGWLGELEIGVFYEQGLLETIRTIEEDGTIAGLLAEFADPQPADAMRSNPIGELVA